MGFLWPHSSKNRQEDLAAARHEHAQLRTSCNGKAQTTLRKQAAAWAQKHVLLGQTNLQKACKGAMCRHCSSSEGVYISLGDCALSCILSSFRAQAICERMRSPEQLNKDPDNRAHASAAQWAPRQGLRLSSTRRANAAVATGQASVRPRLR